MQSEGAQIRRLVRERENIGEVEEFLQPLSDLQVASSTPSADSERCGEPQMGSSSPIDAVTVTAEGESLLESEPEEIKKKRRSHMRVREEPPGNCNMDIIRTVEDRIGAICEQLDDDALTQPALNKKVAQIISGLEPELPECMRELCAELFCNLVKGSLVALSADLTCRRRICSSQIKTASDRSFATS